MKLMQPVHPIRIWQKGVYHNFCHPVFAIAIANELEVRYVTINGMVLLSSQIMYAETLLEGRWQAIHTIPKPHADPA